MARSGLVVAVLMVLVAWAESPARAGPGLFEPVDPPVPAPTVALTDLEGRRVTLEDFAGKVVLVNLWATWCPPCVAEMPQLDQMAEAMAEDVRVVAVSMDRNAKLVTDFLARQPVDHITVLHDPKQALGRALEARGLPTSVVLTPDGQVVGRLEGMANWASPWVRGWLLEQGDSSE